MLQKHTADTSSLVAQHVRHFRPLNHANARSARARQQRRVEHHACDSQAAIAKSAKTVTRDKLTANLIARRSVDDHTRQRSRL